KDVGLEADALAGELNRLVSRAKRLAVLVELHARAVGQDNRGRDHPPVVLAAGREIDAARSTRLPRRARLLGTAVGARGLFVLAPLGARLGAGGEGGRGGRGALTDARADEVHDRIIGDGGRGAGTHSPSPTSTRVPAVNTLG